MRVSLRTWTMCTWSRSQTGSVQSTRLCGNHCGPTPGSEFMEARRTFGTKKVRNQMRARRCRGSQKSPTRGHRCGAVPRSLPLGHPDFVATHLLEIRRKHDALLKPSPTVPARGASRVPRAHEDHPRCLSRVAWVCAAPGGRSWRHTGASRADALTVIHPTTADQIVYLEGAPEGLDWT